MHYSCCWQRPDRHHDTDGPDGFSLDEGFLELSGAAQCEAVQGWGCAGRSVAWRSERVGCASERPALNGVKLHVTVTENPQEAVWGSTLASGVLTFCLLSVLHSTCAPGPAWP